MSNPDDILYAPIYTEEPWRSLARLIIKYIENHRKTDRAVLSLTRQRPKDALRLMDFLEAYHGRGVTRFWRLSYPSRLTPVPFEFGGYVSLPNSSCQFPAFGEVMRLGVNPRSIEDANLVPNTYCHDYIFEDHTTAWNGLKFLMKFFP